MLFVGDVVGRPGRESLAAAIPELRETHRPDAVVVNGENAAGGLGITPRIADELLGLGVDVLTLGNHTFRHPEIEPYLDEQERIVRPANLPASLPGRGHVVVEAGGIRLAVVNLMGAAMLEVSRSPFIEADIVLQRLEGEADAIVVDFHAEMTSEKVAMGWHLDGRVAAVLGTHTHVPTADARVLPGGTGYISDVGMTGSRAGVIGMDRDLALERFRTLRPLRLESAKGDEWVMAVLVEIDPSGRALAIEQVLHEVAAPGGT